LGRLYLEAGGAAVDAPDAQGRTPLEIAGPGSSARSCPKVAHAVQSVL
jgi:hypothetical protein